MIDMIAMSDRIIVILLFQGKDVHPAGTAGTVKAGQKTGPFIHKIGVVDDWSHPLCVISLIKRVYLKIETTRTKEEIRTIRLIHCLHPFQSFPPEAVKT